jgi:hypothetical protein
MTYFTGYMKLALPGALHARAVETAIEHQVAERT